MILRHSWLGTSLNTPPSNNSNRINLSLRPSLRSKLPAGTVTHLHHPPSDGPNLCTTRARRTMLVRLHLLPRGLRCHHLRHRIQGGGESRGIQQAGIINCIGIRICMVKIGPRIPYLIHLHLWGAGLLSVYRKSARISRMSSTSTSSPSGYIAVTKSLAIHIPLVLLGHSV